MGHGDRDYQSGHDRCVDSALTVIRKSVYDAEGAVDATRCETSSAAASGGGYTLTVITTTEGTGYVHLVQAAIGEETVTIAKSADGTYSIPAGVAEVVVTSVILGDVDLNGTITASDTTSLARHVASLDILPPIAQLAADVDFNQVLTAADATTIQRYIAQLITSFWREDSK